MVLERIVAWFGEGLASSCLWSIVMNVTAFVWAGSRIGGWNNEVSWRWSGQLCLVSLGLCYILAALSLRVQVVGLAGSCGILPVATTVSEHMQWTREALHAHKRRGGLVLKMKRAKISLFVRTMVTGRRWCGGDWDRLLLRLCDVCAASGAGIAIAAARSELRFGGTILPLLLALSYWAYFCLRLVTGEFTSLQWDALLLEAAVTALPLAVAPLNSPSAIHTGVWLLQILSFKLLFSSGVVKLASGCPAWRSLTAMNFHYWTQPLPHALSFFANGLPPVIHRLSTFATLARVPSPILLEAS